MNTTTARTIPASVQDGVRYLATRITDVAYLVSENRRVYGERSAHASFVLDANLCIVQDAQARIAYAMNLATAKGLADEMAAFIASLNIPTIE